MVSWAALFCIPRQTSLPQHQRLSVNELTTFSTSLSTSPKVFIQFLRPEKVCSGPPDPKFL